MAPFPIFPAWILSKMYGAKLIYEIKDIWPLSLVALGGFNPSHPFIKFMAFFEKFALKRSDVIVSNLQNYGEHIKNDVGLERNFEWISNGVDLDELNQIEPLDKNIQDKIPKNKFIVGYTGTVGVANALESFLESAIQLQNEKEILFVIVGNGQEKEKLVKKYGNYTNILFIDAITKKQVQSMLKSFDICFLGWNKEPLYNYGTSANKIFDYMYSGKPILNAFSGKGDIVQIAQCGVSVEAENTEAITKGILELYNTDKEKREALGQRGKAYVLKHFTYEKLAERYEGLL